MTNALVVNTGGFLALRQEADIYVKSGFLPKAINTVEKAMAIMLQGKELDIPPMQALKHLHVIEGKVGMSAELMHCLALQRCPESTINILESTNEKCVVEASRPGHKAKTFAFTIEDATRAGLLGKDNWKRYPRAMLRSRAVAEMARAMFPDCIGGVSHTPEELGAITDEKGVITIEPAEETQNLTKLLMEKAKDLK